MLGKNDEGVEASDTETDPRSHGVHFVAAGALNQHAERADPRFDPADWALYIIDDVEVKRLGSVCNKDGEPIHIKYWTEEIELDLSYLDETQDELAHLNVRPMQENARVLRGARGKVKELTEPPQCQSTEF